jgi:hypothetical protein
VLDNGNLLRMAGPATFDAVTGRVTLTASGYIEDKDGNMLQRYPYGATIQPNIQRPYTLHPAGKLVLPSGMLLPMRNEATLRLPIIIPQEDE